MRVNGCPHIAGSSGEGDIRLLLAAGLITRVMLRLERMTLLAEEHEGEEAEGWQEEGKSRVVGVLSSQRTTKQREGKGRCSPPRFF